MALAPGYHDAEGHHHQVKIEMDYIVQWLRCNKLTLNVGKTKMVIFGTKNKLQNIINNTPLLLGTEPIERVEVFKYLGMLLDENLSFDQHIQKLYSKTCSKIGMIKKIRLNIDCSLALTLYKSLVLPH